MIQKDYTFKSPLHAGSAIADIKKTLENTPHKDALLVIYETGYPKAKIRGLIDMLKCCGVKGLKIAGIAIYSVADILPDGTGVRLNLILTENSDIEIVGIPCVPGEEDKAAMVMRERLSEFPDAKAVEILGCNLALDVTRFMEQSFREREDIAVFGTMTSVAFPEHVTNKGFERFLFDLGSGTERSQMVIAGDDLIPEGFSMIIFSGKELKVSANYALGWHPIGKEMPVVLGKRGELGETTIAQIDGFRAVDLFKEYLGVNADKYLINNICEFPLMVRRGEDDICMIPFSFGKEGEVYINATLHEDEKLRFSFASHDEVLGASERSRRLMQEFAPEALFLIVCGNRAGFLREDAPQEWECFRDVCSDLALIHGACEIYYQNGRCGILTSAHISIGMREGERPERIIIKDDDEIECHHHEHIIPLADRMSVFMNKMTSQLIEIAKEAKASNNAKSAFLSNMSHEIRTPINAILGMDEMILRESNESSIIGYGEDIRSAGNNLLCIVNDILDFSKIEAGKMDILPVEYEFASVINDLVNVVKKRVEDKGLELKLDIDPAIPSILYGDEIRIKQVITNILTNAVKYTEKGSVTLSIKRIEFKCDMTNVKGHEECHGMACYRNPVKLYVGVTDTGIGIKDSEKEKLFNAFERVDEKRNRTIEGTGLGLNITASLLKLMDSSLEVSSTYGEGSTFSFVIKQGISRDEPVGDLNDRWSRSYATHVKYHEKFTAEQAHILVVDDTRMNLEVMKNLLKKTRIQIDTAESGEEALELVRQNFYDIIFLDHRMPHMDGMECFARMKELKDHKCPDSPVISLTANAVSGAREEYLTAGFADYLTKPIDSEKLEDMLIRYLPEDKVKIAKEPEKKAKVSGRGSKISGSKPRIVLIDDAQVIHDYARNLLGDKYILETCLNGKDGIKAVKEKETDLILLDILMPDEDGFEVMKKLKADARCASVPVIFLTGDENEETEIKGFKSGAWDFVRKPFVAEVLLQRVKHTIELSRLQNDLTREVAVKTLRIEHLTQEVMLALSKTVDAKDHYTNGHSERVAGYATMLAMKLGMEDNAQSDIHAMGLLHDVGKIGVPREIINKPGRLTDEEFAKIKEHTTMGYDILKTITELPGLATGARWHHERFNGTGYPDGKSGEDIPLAARIICVADCYDAMTSNRSYSKIREQSEVRNELLRCKGSQFDPVIADAMVSLMDADGDYLMNEQGYKDSAVAKYVTELLNRTLRMGSLEEGNAAEDAIYDDTGDSFEGAGDEASDEIQLPDWLKESSAVDAESGVKNCGSVESYLSILTNFHATVLEKADEIQGYYDNEDWDNYTVKVHALKSSARIIGAMELSEKARILEAAGDAGDIETIAEDTGALITLYRSYEDALSMLSESDEGLPKADQATLSDAYGALSEFASSMDYELSRMVLDSMKEYKLDPSDKDRFSRIRTALSQLDWDRIKSILSEKG